MANIKTSLVSEELSSVETKNPGTSILYSKRVSEELSSVETGDYERWRRGLEAVSEELSSVETCIQIYP